MTAGPFIAFSNGWHDSRTDDVTRFVGYWTADDTIRNAKSMIVTLPSPTFPWDELHVARSILSSRGIETFDRHSCPEMLGLHRFLSERLSADYALSAIKHGCSEAMVKAVTIALAGAEQPPDDLRTR